MIKFDKLTLSLPPLCLKSGSVPAYEEMKEIRVMAFHHHNQRSIKMLVVGSRWDKVSLPKKREITHRWVARLFCRQCLNGLAVAHRPWLQDHLFRFWLSNVVGEENEPSSLKSEVFVVRDWCKMRWRDVETILCANPIKSDVRLTMVSYYYFFYFLFLPISRMYQLMKLSHGSHWSQSSCWGWFPLILIVARHRN